MDNLTPEQRRKNMQNIRSSGTKAELQVFKELKKRKIYFASNVRSIVGKPDIVFRRKKVAVFIDSDFWHGHPKRCIMPKSNIEYWSQKISRNKARDRKVNNELREQGWTVIRIWEHNIKKHYNRSINKIINAIR